MSWSSFGKSGMAALEAEVAASRRTFECGNCRRERLLHDVFWHVEDECWYCQDVQACEYRYYIQGEREASNQESSRG